MEFTLDRFRSAHENSYEIALQEIKGGRKESHWIWYIFPQIQGLGHSTMAMYYEIQSKTEAVEYWNDPVLRSHMVEICQELLKLEGSIDWKRSMDALRAAGYDGYITAELGTIAAAPQFLYDITSKALDTIFAL